MAVVAAVVEVMAAHLAIDVPCPIDVRAFIFGLL